MKAMMQLQVLALIFFYLSGTAYGHGYLAEPPGRASAWRYGFDTPIDYEDDMCYCGGFTYQYEEMGGKCGLCGDPWDQDPREHEVGGIYATGTIVRDYTQGQVITATANLSGNHLGHFEYKICANNDVTVEATQECLDLTPLYAVGQDDWHLNIGDAAGLVNFDLQLPADLTCSQCVLQWRYEAGNNWGTCENGTEAEGCGPQEEFRGCADVSISAAKSQKSPESLDAESQSEVDSQTGEAALADSNAGPEVEEGSEEKSDEEANSDTKVAGQPQKSLKLIEEMAVALNSNTEKRSSQEQEILQALKSEAVKDDEDDTDLAVVEEEEEEYDSDSDSESEDDE